MKFNAYTSQLGTVSEVKRTILRELWGSDNTPFPKPWVQSSHLLKLTGQKYFDRRIRELRDEHGCDIETGTISGEHCYRFKSSTINAANPRYYLTEAEKRSLFQRFSYTCQICGKRTAAGARGLQADHKMPLIRGGNHSISNWQPICVECNVGKRGACEGCKDECRKCPWAFPEIVGRTTLVRLTPKLLGALYEKCENSQAKVEAAIVAAITKFLNL